MPTVRRIIERAIAGARGRRNGPLLPTYEETAGELNCSVDTIRRHVKAGDLSTIRVGTGGKKGGVRIVGSSIDAFIERRTH